MKLLLDSISTGDALMHSGILPVALIVLVVAIVVVTVVIRNRRKRK